MALFCIEKLNANTEVHSRGCPGETTHDACKNWPILQVNFYHADTFFPLWELLSEAQMKPSQDKKFFLIIFDSIVNGSDAVAVIAVSLHSLSSPLLRYSR